MLKREEERGGRRKRRKEESSKRGVGGRVKNDGGVMKGQPWFVDGFEKIGGEKVENAC